MSGTSVRHQFKAVLGLLIFCQLLAGEVECS